MSSVAMETGANTRSDSYAKNAEIMQSFVDELRERHAVVSQGGERHVARHKARGKLTARERVDRLLDIGADFLELGAFAAWDMYSKDVHSAGLITGIGVVSGVECMIVANDPTIKGGTYHPMTVKKHLRAKELAQENRLRCN